MNNMGKWKELETEITLHIDGSFDELITIGQQDGFQGLSGLAFQIKKGVERASSKAVSDLAKHNRSLQQRFIADISVHPYASGMLASSIIEQKKGEYQYLIGTRINNIYPMSVEYGRKEIRPKNAKVLWFYSLSGEIVFTKHVGPAEPRPFVEPAYKETERIAQKVTDALIDKELSVFR